MSVKMGENFIKEDPWRIFRIMAEFVDGFEELSKFDEAVAIFGSARTKPGAKYYKAAEKTAELLVQNGYAVITGAGPGIMAAGNKGAMDAKGDSIGLNILIPIMQKPNPFVTKLVDFKYFFCRKVMFLKYSKAVIVFPGGFGTMDEFFEAVTLVQTKRIDPFPVICFGSEYWKGLVEWINEELLGGDMIEKADLDIFKIVDTPEDAVEAIKAFYRKK